MKYGLLSKHLFQRTQQHDGSKKLIGNDEFVKKCLSVITCNKKHSLKQVVPVTYTL